MAEDRIKLSNSAYCGRPRKVHVYRGITIRPVHYAGSTSRWLVEDPREGHRPVRARTLEEAKISAASLADCLAAEKEE